MADVNRILIEIITVLRDKGLRDSKGALRGLEQDTRRLDVASEQHALAETRRNRQLIASYSMVDKSLQQLEERRRVFAERALADTRRAARAGASGEVKRLDEQIARLRAEEQRLLRLNLSAQSARGPSGRFGRAGGTQADLFAVIRDREFQRGLAQLRDFARRGTSAGLEREIKDLETFAVRAAKSNLSLVEMKRRLGDLGANSLAGQIIGDLETKFARVDERLGSVNVRLQRGVSFLQRFRAGLPTRDMSPEWETLLGARHQTGTGGPGDEVRLLSRDLTQVESRLERGILGNLRRISRSDAFHKLIVDSKSVEAGLERADLAARKTVKSFNDLHQVDETTAAGFRRVTRLLSVLVSILPFVSVGFGLLATAGVTLVGGLTALAGSLGTLVGLLGTIPGLALAAGGALAAIATVFKPAITNITAAVHGSLQAQQQQKQNEPKNRQAVSDAEERLTDVRRQSAQQMQDIDRQLADARIKNVEQVRDAERELAHDRITHAEDEADIRDRIAQQQITNAQRLQDAENRLNSVRKRNTTTERGLLEDLFNARAGVAGLRAEGADALSIAAQQGRVNQAQIALDRFRASPAAREEVRAEKDVQRIKKDNVHDIKKLREELRRKIRDDNFAEQTALTNIQRMRRDNAKEIAKLEKQRHDTAMQNAAQERDALQALIVARQTLTTGNRKDFLQGLSPGERGVAESMLRIRDAWLKLTAGTRSRFLDSLQAFLDWTERHLPAIANLVDRFAHTLIDLWEKAFRNFSTGGNAGAIKRLFEDGVPVLRDFGDALIAILDALVKIGDAARPLTRALSRGVRDLAQGVQGRVTQASLPGTGVDKRSDLDRFFERTRRVGDLLVDSLKNLGGALLEVLRIAEPFGEVLLRDFLKWTEKVQGFVTSQHGRESLRSFFADVTPVFEDLIRLGADVVKTLFNIGRELIRPGDSGEKSFFATVLEGLDKSLPTLQRFVVESVRQNGPAMIRFVRELGRAIGVLVGPGGVFVRLLDLIGGLIGLINKLDKIPGGDVLLKFFFAFITLGPVLANLTRSLKALGLAFAVFTEGGKLASIGVIARTAFGKWLAIALLLFGSMENIERVLGAVTTALKTILGPIDRVFDAFGIGGGRVGGIALLALGFSRVRTAILDVVKALVGALIPALFKARAVEQVLDSTRRRSRTDPGGKGLPGLPTPIPTRIPTSSLFKALGIAGAAVTITLLAKNFADSGAGKAMDAFVNKHFPSWLGGDKPLKLHGIDDLIKLRDESDVGRKIVESIVKDIKSGTPEGDRLSREIGVRADELGGLLAEGMSDGFTRGQDRMLNHAVAVTRRNLQRIKQEIDANTPRIADAVDALTSEVNQHFDALLEVQTPESKRLAAFDAAQLAKDRAEQIAGANAGVVAAQKQLAKDLAALRAPITGNARERAETRKQQRETVAQDRIALKEASKQRRDTLSQIRSQEQREKLVKDADAAETAKRKRIEQERNATNAALDAAKAELDKAVASNDPKGIAKARDRIIGILTAHGLWKAGGAAMVTGLTAGFNAAIDQFIRVVKQRVALVKTLITTQETGKRLRAAQLVPGGTATFTFDQKGNITGFNLGLQPAAGAPPAAPPKTAPAGPVFGPVSTPEDFVSRLTPAKEKKLLDYMLKRGIQANRIRKDRAAKMSDEDILLEILRKGAIGLSAMRRIANLANVSFAAGGLVPGSMGAQVPIVAHAGEWVVNAMQQRRAAAMAGVTPEALSRALFQNVVDGNGAFQFGGVVRDGGRTVNAPITINNPAAPLDPNYLARILEARMRSVA